MTEKTKWIIRKSAKLTLTSPIWIFLLTLGSISELIRITGELIEGIGKSIRSGGRSLDGIFTRTFTSPGSWCEKMADWVNK